MSFNVFDNPKTQFVFGAQWASETGVSASSKLAPIPVDILSGAIPVIQIIFNGATFDRAREANVFKTAQASVAGSTAVWVPVAGKKFRLLGFTISLTENATVAVAGVVTVSLLDAAGVIAIAYDVYVPAVAVAGVGTAFDITVDLGKLGYLSALANNVLNANLSVALTTGNFRINVRGTEE